MLGVSRGRVIVRVGRQPARAVSIGRLELRIRWINSPRWGWFGFVEGDEEERSRAAQIAIVAGGPLVTAIVLAGLVAAAGALSWPASILLWVPALAVGWELFVTAVPMRYPRWFGTVRRACQRRLPDRPPAPEPDEPRLIRTPNCSGGRSWPPHSSQSTSNADVKRAPHSGQRQRISPRALRTRRPGARPRTPRSNAARTRSRGRPPPSRRASCAAPPAASSGPSTRADCTAGAIVRVGADGDRP